MFGRLHMLIADAVLWRNIWDNIYYLHRLLPTNIKMIKTLVCSAFCNTLFKPQIWQIRTGWYFMMMMVRRSARNIQKCIHYQRLQRASWDVGWSICGLKLVMCRLFILDLATQLTLLLQLDLSHWNTNTWYLQTKLHQDSEGTFYRCHRLAI